MKRTAMSTRELRRVEVFGQVAGRSLRLRDAAEILQLSYRQAKRLWRRYRQEGPSSLQHRSAGRPSHHAKPTAFREHVLQLIRAKYSGSLQERFGPTLAAEHLAEEDGLPIDAETLRRWMLAAGLWSRRRGRKRAHRRRRPRKEHFGELVQLDGSFHAWFEQRGPRGCLMNMVDDATSKTQSHLGKEETLWDAVAVLRLWIENYGVPLALYTDWKNVYKVAPTPQQELRGETPLTEFGRMCARLGIRIIAASSPQAKGRVERKNGVHQDRLVKKFRRQNIQTYEVANAYLQAEYLPALNQRFAQNPARPEDYHRAKPSAAEMDAIFRLETERWVSNDWVVRYHGRYLQLLPPRCCDGPRVHAQVYESPNGTLEVCYRGAPLAWEEISIPPAVQETQGTVHVPHSRPRRKPGREHPYRQGYRDRMRLIREKLLQRGSGAHPAGGASAPPSGSAPAPPAPSPCHPTEGTLLSS
jgi:transposase